MQMFIRKYCVYLLSSNFLFITVILQWRHSVSVRLVDGKSESESTVRCPRMWMAITHKAALNAAKHFRLFFFFFSVSHLELPPSQRWSWEEAPSGLLVRRKELNSAQISTPCNTHPKYLQLKLETQQTITGLLTTTISPVLLIWICRHTFRIPRNNSDPRFYCLTKTNCFQQLCIIMCVKG